MKVTTYAVRRRIAAGVISIALVVLGIYSFMLMPVNFLPDVTYPLIKVHIWWRGATPEEISTNIADPLERQMAMVDNLDYLESSSIEGMYTLLANFKYGVNIDVAYQDALAAIARVARQLPKDMDPPLIMKADPSQLPVVQLTISSDSMGFDQTAHLDGKLAAISIAGGSRGGGYRHRWRPEAGDPRAPGPQRHGEICPHPAGGDEKAPGGEP